MTDEPISPEPARQRQIWVPRQLDSLVEQRIREAAECGEFDRLPTKGKPLSLDLKDAIDHDAWFVSRTLHSLGAVPVWMELGKEIDSDEARLRAMTGDFLRWLAETRRELSPLGREARFTRLPALQLRFDDRYGRCQTLALVLREKIERFNFEVPVRSLEKPGVWVAHELQRLREPYEALLHELGLDAAIGQMDQPGASAVERPGSSTEVAAADNAPLGAGIQSNERARRLLELWRRFTTTRRSTNVE